MTRATATTHTDALYMARVYLAQARVQRHRPAWHATLLRWAAGHRAAAMRQHRAAHKQAAA